MSIDGSEFPLDNNSLRIGAGESVHREKKYLKKENIYSASARIDNLLESKFPYLNKINNCFHNKFNIDFLI